MIDLPIKAEVHCPDGMAGFSTYVIGNPIDHQFTHLVVKSLRPPFHEYLVPVGEVVETTPHQIKLNCTLNEMERMEPFVFEEYLRIEYPAYLCSPYALPVQPYEEVTYVSVKRHNIPQGEVSVWVGAMVEATDGIIGQVDELLINKNNMQVTHLILRERHIFGHREITIPISQIKHICDDAIYLKLDRRSIEEMPTTPIQRWQLHKNE